MTCRFVFLTVGLLITGARAYAPIHWARLPNRGLVLKFGGSLANAEGAAQPTRLLVGDTADDTFGNAPHFSAKLDQTIAWNGWCIETEEGGNRGAAVYLARCTGGPSQRWNWVPDEHGRNMIQLKDSNMCLDVVDQALVELEECANKASELWTFEEPLHALRQNPAHASTLRNVAISLVGLAGLVILTFSTWLRKPHSRAHMSFARHAGLTLKTSQGGGISLSPPRSAGFPRLTFRSSDTRCSEAATPEEAAKLKFAIIGAGCIGREHISNIALLESATVVAVADTYEDSRTACKELLNSLHMTSCQVIEDYHDLLNMPEIDAIIVATPNHHHIHVIRDAFKCGVKGLLVEKPLCTTMEDCMEVMKLVDAHPQTVFWVGMEYRYIPPVDRLITQVHKGVIGSPKMLSIREHRFPFLQKVDNWNRFSQNTGGTLVEKCCHFFDLMLYIIGSKPIRVMGSGGQDVNHLDEFYDGRRSDILDNAFVIVDFEGGARACLDLCMFAEVSRHQEEISCVGDCGKIEAFAPAHGADRDDESLPNFVIGTTDKQRNITDEPPPPKKPEEQHISIDERLMEAGHHCGATYYELERFAHAVQTRGKVDVDATDGMLAVALGLAAHTAIDENRIVELSEFGIDEYWNKRQR